LNVASGGEWAASSSPSRTVHVAVPKGLTHRAIVVVLAVLLGFLTLAPLATVLVGSFRPDGLPFSPGWTLNNYIEVWGAGYTWQLLGNTLLFACCSSALAIAIALSLSWLVERTDLPGRSLFHAAILMPMATPPLLLAIGWVLVLSPQIGLVSLAVKPWIGPIDRWLNLYSLGGAIFVQGLAYVPTCVLILSPAIRAMDPAYEEAAFVARANRAQVWVKIVLPLLTPTLISLSTILILVGILAFDVPAVIGIPGNVKLMSIEVYRLMTPPSGLPDYGASSALNGAVFFLIAPGVLIYRLATRSTSRFATITGKAYRPNRAPLGRWRWFAVGFVVVYVVAAVVLPLLALVWTSLSPYFGGLDPSLFHRLSFAAYGDVLTDARVWSAAANALQIAVVVVLTLVLTGLLVAWAVLRSGVCGVVVLDVLAMMPLGIPSLMMSVALIFLAFSFRVIPIYGTIWLIALGHFIVFLPVAVRMMQSGLLQIGAELEEAGAVAGGSLAQVFRRILVPLLRPTIIAAAIWIAVHSIREFSIAVMLQSGRNNVLSTLLYTLWQTGSSARAAALAVLLMLSLCFLVACSSFIARHREP
jgi:iron(III) transport system permease protein